MTTDILKYMCTCDMCQWYKKNSVKYGKFPTKLTESTSWKLLCMDLVGSYTVTLENNKESPLNSMTFIDPTNGWFEVCEISNKTSVKISHLLDHIWLSRYPHPERIIFDNGPEFKNDFHFIFNDY